MTMLCEKADLTKAGDFQTLTIQLIIFPCSMSIFPFEFTRSLESRGFEYNG